MSEKPNKGRVTVDIDSYEPGWRLRAVRAQHELERLGAVVEVSVSSSGSGLHIEGWFDRFIDDEEDERLRRYLGDDVNRIELDATRGRQTHSTRQVLWTQKGDGEAELGFEDVYEALDYVDSMNAPSSYDQMRAYANDGRKAYASHQHPKQQLHHKL